MPVTQFYSSAPPHQTTHQSGQRDALTGPLDANARIALAVAGVVQGTRREINLIAGSGITIAAVNDAANEKVDVTISAAASGSQKRTGAAMIGLSTVTTPSVRTGHVLRVRAARAAGDSGSLLVWLYENVGGVMTLRSGPYTITLAAAYATTAFSIPSGDAANIANYANLAVQVQGIADVGATLTPTVSQIELEVPV